MYLLMEITSQHCIVYNLSKTTAFRNTTYLYNILDVYIKFWYQANPCKERIFDLYDPDRFYIYTHCENVCVCVFLIARGSSSDSR